MKRLRVSGNHCILFAVFICTALSASPLSVFAMTVSLKIPEKYSQIDAGGVVYFETEVKYPENDTRKDLRIEYSVVDENNKEVAYLKVLKAIETQASFMDSISIPESVNTGLYKVRVKIADYGSLSEEVGASFMVAAPAADRVFFYLFLVLGVVICIALLVSMELFILIRRKRI